MNPRHATLTLASGKKITLAPASCLFCRTLVGACWYCSRRRIWDGLGFSQDGLIRFTDHACPARIVAAKVRELSDAFTVPDSK